jgi:hypothetical protein
MNEKKQTYESTTNGLPPLKTVLGEVPSPEPGHDPSRPVRPFVVDKSESEVKGTVNKLIGHLRKSDW